MSTENPTKRPFTIVVGSDYSELSEQAFAEAVSTARAHDCARIHVIHVIDTAPGGSLVGTVVPDLTEESRRLRVHVELLLAGYTQAHTSDRKQPFESLSTHIGLYGAARSIAQLAADVEADLVIVGTHGRRGATRFLLGSVAETTVRLSPCPVLVVRPRGAAADTATPQIEPPCSQCLETRRSTDGVTFWCDQHREHRQRGHTYHFDSNRSSHQSGLLIPF